MYTYKHILNVYLHILYIYNNFQCLCLTPTLQYKNIHFYVQVMVYIFLVMIWVDPPSKSMLCVCYKKPTICIYFIGSQEAHVPPVTPEQQHSQGIVCWIQWRSLVFVPEDKNIKISNVQRFSVSCIKIFTENPCCNHAKNAIKIRYSILFYEYRKVHSSPFTYRQILTKYMYIDQLKEKKCTLMCSCI